MKTRALISAAACAALALAACSEPAPAPDTPPPGGTPATPNDPAPVPTPPGSPSDAPYVGVWAGPQADCANAPASGERAPIEITRTGFLGYENRCDIQNVTPQTEGFDAVLACEAEGMRSTERVRMAVAGETLTLTYADRDGATASFRRCPN